VASVVTWAIARSCGWDTAAVTPTVMS
jgi:hypothetical protein